MHQGGMIDVLAGKVVLWAMVEEEGSVCVFSVNLVTQMAISLT